MRNLVLSAFPRSMRLPDPFTQDLKVDMLPEVAQPPRYSPAAENLLPPAVRAEVDAILSGKVPAASAGALTQRLVSTQQEYAATGSRYNVPLINAVVFYVGIRAVEASAPTPGTVPPTSGTAAIDLLAALLRDMDNGEFYSFTLPVAWDF